MDRKKALQYGKFSRVYMECGRFDDAAILQTQVKDYLYKMLGMDDSRTKSIVLALAGTYCMLSEFNKALVLQQEALDSCIKSLGREHYETLQVMDILGKSSAPGDISMQHSDYMKTLSRG